MKQKIKYSRIFYKSRKTSGIHLSAYSIIDWVPSTSNGLGDDIKQIYNESIADLTGIKTPLLCKNNFVLCSDGQPETYMTA